MTEKEVLAKYDELMNKATVALNNRESSTVLKYLNEVKQLLNSNNMLTLNRLKLIEANIDLVKSYSNK